MARAAFWVARPMFPELTASLRVGRVVYHSDQFGQILVADNGCAKLVGYFLVFSHYPVYVGNRTECLCQAEVRCCTDKIGFGSVLSGFCCYPIGFFYILQHLQGFVSFGDGGELKRVVGIKHTVGRCE